MSLAYQLFFRNKLLARERGKPKKPRQARRWLEDFNRPAFLEFLWSLSLVPIIFFDFCFPKAAEVVRSRQLQHDWLTFQRINRVCRFEDFSWRRHVGTLPRNTSMAACTGPQMIPNYKWSPDRKWSLSCTANVPRTGNDPQSVPQMIPDLKQSPRHKRWKCEDTAIWNYVIDSFI